MLSNRLAAGGGRRIPEAVLERDYCIAWFLIGLSSSPLRDQLAFKGGTALKRCYFGEYRFSEDLDFTLLSEATLDAIVAQLDHVFEDVRRLSGVVLRYSREERDEHENTYEFYIGYEGPLPGASREIKVNITIRELLVWQLTNQPVLRAYDEYTDLPEGALVQAYALEEIATEKIMALTDPARNEPRDLYDLWFLVTGRHVDLGELRSGLEQKLAFKGRDALRLGELLVGKEARLRRDWVRRLSGQMVELPEFDSVFRAVQRSLRQARLAGGSAMRNTGRRKRRR
ncbi:MAG: nucleotidyl transferase AbiEii/AbiGii toxin family protein [Candidatus Methylomirabilales bacterium]